MEEATKMKNEADMNVSMKNNTKIVILYVISFLLLAISYPLIGYGLFPKHYAMVDGQDDSTMLFFLDSILPFALGLISAFFSYLIYLWKLPRKKHLLFLIPEILNLGGNAFLIWGGFFIACNASPIYNGIILAALAILWTLLSVFVISLHFIGKKEKDTKTEEPIEQK